MVVGANLFRRMMGKYWGRQGDERERGFLDRGGCIRRGEDTLNGDSPCREKAKGKEKTNDTIEWGLRFLRELREKRFEEEEITSERSRLMNIVEK